MRRMRKTDGRVATCGGEEKSKNPNTWKQEKWDDNIKRKQEDRKQKKEVGKEGGRNEMVR